MRTIAELREVVRQAEPKAGDLVEECHRRMAAAQMIILGELLEAIEAARGNAWRRELAELCTRVESEADECTRGPVGFEVNARVIMAMLAAELRREEKP